MDLVRQGDVVDIAALALEETRVLGPRHRLSDSEFHGGPSRTVR